MKVSASLSLVLFVLCSGVAPQTAYSSARSTEPFIKIFTNSDQMLMFTSPLGVRNLGLGAAGVADDSDPNNSFYNPANLQSQTFYYVTMGYNERLRNSIYSMDVYDAGLYGGASLPLENGNEVRLGFGAKFVQGASSFLPDSRTIFLPSGTFVPQTTRDWYMLLSGAIGVGFGPADVGAGVSLKPYSVERPDGRVNQWAFDAGFIAKIVLLEDGPVTVTPSLGASVLNLGDDVELAPNFSEPLPREARFGAGLRVATRATSSIRFLDNGPVFSLFGILDAVRPVDSGTFNPEDALAYGLEAGLFDALFLRGGIIDRDQAATQSTWGVGLALHTGTVVLRGDYAHREGLDGFFPQEATDAFSLGLAYDF